MKNSKNRSKKQAFIFTLDALLVLPLIILIISSLISFSSTLKENVLLHEYSYIIASDSLNYLSELEIGQIPISGLQVTAGESSISVLEFVINRMPDSNTPNSTAMRLAVEGALNTKIPSFAGYIFEYKDSSGNWTQIARGGNTAKLASGNYSFQVSAIKVVTGLFDPVISQDPCSEDILCTIPPTPQPYNGILGPEMFRIRVFA